MNTREQYIQKRKIVRIVNESHVRKYVEILRQLPQDYDHILEEYYRDFSSICGFIGAAKVIAGSDSRADQYSYGEFISEYFPKLDELMKTLILQWFASIQQTAQYYDLIWQD